jgi:hypothetical protein
MYIYTCIYIILISSGNFVLLGGGAPALTGPVGLAVGGGIFLPSTGMYTYIHICSHLYINVYVYIHKHTLYIYIHIYILSLLIGLFRVRGRMNITGGGLTTVGGKKCTYWNYVYGCLRASI